MRRHALVATPVVLLLRRQTKAIWVRMYWRGVPASCHHPRSMANRRAALFRAAHRSSTCTSSLAPRNSLVRFMPAEGYAPVRSLVLDQDLYGSLLFRVVLGFESPPSELDLLKWAGDAQRREQFSRAGGSRAERSDTGSDLRFPRGTGEMCVLQPLMLAARTSVIASSHPVCQSLEDKTTSSEADRAGSRPPGSVLWWTDNLVGYGSPTGQGR